MPSLPSVPRRFCPTCFDFMLKQADLRCPVCNTARDMKYGLVDIEVERDHPEVLARHAERIKGNYSSQCACGRIAHARGLCISCYSRERKSGRLKTNATRATTYSQA